MKEIDKINQIHGELRELIDELKNIEKYLSIPRAAQRFGISADLLRKWAKENSTWAIVKNANAKNPHYLIDVVKFHKWLEAGGPIADAKKML